MIFQYLRISSDTQTIENQRDEIDRYCSLNNMAIDKTIEIEISSRKDTRERKIDYLVEQLQADKDDHTVLIITELSRLGRNTGEVISLIDTLIKLGVEVRILKQNLILRENDPMQKMTLVVLSMFSEFERDIISQRTKEALKGLKNKGISLGKPVGTIQNSKYDTDKNKILSLLELGLSYQKIVDKHLEYGSASSLYTYVKKRELLTV